MIPYGRQSISEEDIAAVVEVLRSDWITQGPSIDRFEQGLAAYCGARHGVLVSNATAALHLACLALGVGKGSLVWTSPNTFLASANCALYCGAEVDFVDIDPATYNMSVPELERKLVAAKAAGRLPQVVIPVHFAGQSCDMAGIARLAREYGFRVVEDASHAVGADYLDGKVGSCQYSDIAIFSFHPVKILTTGEGGMLMTNDAALHQQLARLRSHGMVRTPELAAERLLGRQLLEQLVGRHLGEEGVHRDGGGDRVDADAELRALHAGGAGQRVDAGLGRGVVRLADLGAPADDAGVVDDDAPALGLHLLQGGAGAAERAVEGHVEHPEPLLVGHVDELGGAAESRVVDHHVQPTVLRDRRRDEVVDLVLLGHVADDPRHPEGLGGLGEAPLVPVGDDDGRALLLRLLGGGEADAGAGGGRDDDDLVLQQPVARDVLRHRSTSSARRRPRP